MLPPPADAPARWASAPSSVADAVVVLPVKPPARGKSRLGGDPGRRADLAAAFALDTAAAALGTPGVRGVLAVCDDYRFARDLVHLGCAVIPDGVAGELNLTLVQGAQEAVRRWPGALPVALCADLPALSTADLAAALREAHDLTARDTACFVADADGVGTTLYAAPAELFAPRFGSASASEHQHAGALPLTGYLATLRRDVDDPATLRAAAALGMGPRTAALLSD